MHRLVLDGLAPVTPRGIGVPNAARAYSTNNNLNQLAKHPLPNAKQASENKFPRHGNYTLPKNAREL